ncbi:hypothetical protein ACJMK2_038897 [Sinanodonta woodiana]|uniref:Ig-like domain-containing protein n=1 Tax=Sinanodonta woodiana TaxID=1069815 RepID=A0ABD3WE97_SINWO
MYYNNSLKLKLTLTTRIILLLAVVPSTRNQPYEARIGDTKTLGPCKNDKSILNSFVIWEVHQTGKKIHTVTEKHWLDGGRVRIVTNTYEESNLVINTVRETDAGRYICKTGTTGNMNKQADIELIVQSAPKLPLTTKNQIIQEGETDELWCNATGIPIPTIEWFRKSRVTNDSGYENIGASGNMLRIHNVTRYARDIYKCNASNDLGSADGFINVDVSFSAELEVFEEELKRFNTEIGIEMACAVTANPMVNIVWYQGDEEVPIKDKPWKYEVKTDDDMKKDYYTRLSILKILSTLDEADFGTYNCKAHNDSGHVIAAKSIKLVRHHKE